MNTNINMNININMNTNINMIFTIIGVHKHYSVEEWSEWSATHSDILPFVAVSSGTSDADFAKVDAIMDAVDVPFICLDVANGYSEHVRTCAYDMHIRKLIFLVHFCLVL